MRLYKLIGLEIEALQKEYGDNYEEYCYSIEDLLNNYDSMATVIMKESGCRSRRNMVPERRTVVENAEEAVYEEKKVEEMEVYIPDGSFRLYEN